MVRAPVMRECQCHTCSCACYQRIRDARSGLLNGLPNPRSISVPGVLQSVRHAIVESVNSMQSAHTTVDVGIRTLR